MNTEQAMDAAHKRLTDIIEKTKLYKINNKMKTLSDFKKRLTVGTRLNAVNHLTFSGRNSEEKVVYKDHDLGIREVSIVQTNSFAFKTEHKDIKGNITFVDSWCSYPKAKECVIVDENTIQILEETRDKKLVPVLTYKFV